MQAGCGTHGSPVIIDDDICIGLRSYSPSRTEHTRKRGWSGVENLPKVNRHNGRRDDGSEGRRRILVEFGEFAPGNDPGCELFATK